MWALHYGRWMVFINRLGCLVFLGRTTAPPQPSPFHAALSFVSRAWSLVTVQDSATPWHRLWPPNSSCIGRL